MKDNLKFRVSAELKNILGRDLITSPDIAILELVKNSYDAHASKVEITFDEDYLAIADNGKGMSKNDLINKWLFVAYSAKSDGTEDKSYRSKFKRHYAGAKGIGRMSCDRLARNLTLTTRSAEENKTEVLHVDWSVFEINKQTEFDTVDIPHETLEAIPQFPLGTPTGTILEFTGLHLPWSREDIKRLRKSLEKMINPFSGTDDDFQIEIIAPKMRDDDSTAEKHNKVNGVIENSIADVLKLKTTQIESHIHGRTIHTTLKDRGILMYEIEEPNTEFSKLESASVSLFFLNRAAKYNFSARMGVTPVSYGNVFLFRNGFRIFPFGEPDDDSWGLNRRQQQGRNRFLGTRNLFGRVDIETDNVNLIKEVSSRDGGLIETEASRQLMDYFTLVYRRLERYVVGVLWGEGFVRKEYFVNQSSALEARRQLQDIDKDSDSAKHLYSNIGSKVDFLQLIKTLANDKNVNVLRYNEDLANIVSDPTETEVIQAQMLDDVRKLAEKTNDSYLFDKLAEFEKYMDELCRQKEEAERIAEKERKAKAAAERKAEAERKAKEQAEKERDVQIQKNKYLSATRNTTKEVQDLIHVILISSTNSISLMDTAKCQLADKDLLGLRTSLDKFDYHISKINKLSKLITKADLSLLAESRLVDIQNYVQEYLSNYTNSFRVQYHSDIKEPLEKKVSVLDLSIILDNLVSNSHKAGAKELRLDFSREGRTYIVDFTDNGDGVDLSQFTPQSIFEEGVTNRRGGSGIGLSTIRDRMRKELNGDIEFLGNGLHFTTGATFRLTFE